MSHRKMNDPKKRDWLVKQLKKQREEEYYRKRAEDEAAEEQAQYDAEHPKQNLGAQRIVLVGDSFLNRDLATYNNNKNKGNLQVKWSKKRQQEEEEEEDEDDDEEEEEEQDDDEDNEDEDDQEEEETPTKFTKLNIDGPTKRSEVYDESTDDDDEDWNFTKGRVVHFIEQFNEVEVIDNNLTTKQANADLSDANTTATAKQQRAASKSPKHKAKATPNNTPSLSPLNPGEGTPKFLSLNGEAHHNEYAKKKQEQKEKDMLQQMEDLNLNTITTTMNANEKFPQPDPHNLDAAAWWQHILSNGAVIKRDGRLIINVVDFFPLSQQVHIPEDYFHIPHNRKSHPDKPLTAFGLFKRQKLEEDPTLVKKNTHSKQKKSKHAASDKELKELYYKLTEEELEDYQILALCEKLRYKVQRAEHIYAQSTVVQHKIAGHR